MISIESAVNDFLNTFFQESPGAGKLSDEIKGYVLKMKEDGPDGPICSFIVYQKLKINANWVFIHALHTKPEHRKKGYARLLLETLMKMEIAPQIIFVEASKEGPDLKPMFRNLGFIPSPTHDEQVKVDIKSLGEEGKETLVLDNKA
jgi:GNAT superfamily N-acetyltransferase